MHLKASHSLTHVFDCLHASVWVCVQVCLCLMSGENQMNPAILPLPHSLDFI